MILYSERPLNFCHGDIQQRRRKRRQRTSVWARFEHIRFARNKIYLKINGVRMFCKPEDFIKSVKIRQNSKARQKRTLKKKIRFPVWSFWLNDPVWSKTILLVLKRSDKRKTELRDIKVSPRVEKSNRYRQIMSRLLFIDWAWAFFKYKTCSLESVALKDVKFLPKNAERKQWQKISSFSWMNKTFPTYQKLALVRISCDLFNNAFPWDFPWEVTEVFSKAL